MNALYNKIMVASGAGILLILGIVLYGNAKYDKGYNARDTLCIQEIAEQNAQRQDKVIKQKVKYEKIDSRARIGADAILKRMSIEDL